MNLNDLETFILVAQLGTLSGAAERLGVPKSTVSRRVARLEESLELSLLTRSARAIALTEDGRALYERCSPALRELQDIERDLNDHTASPRGKLRLTSSIDLSSSDYLTRHLAEYTARYPEVHVELVVTNRVVDLLEEDVDVGLRVHLQQLAVREGLITKRLKSITFGLFTSPAYLELHGPIRFDETLSRHRFVAHARTLNAPGQLLNHGAASIAPALITDDFQPAAAMIAAGLGLGLLPDFVAAPYLRRHELVQLEPPSEISPPGTLSLVWQRARHMSPRVRAFIDLAVEIAKQQS